MKSVLKYFTKIVSLKYRDEFFREIEEENLYRLILISLLMTITEISIMLFFRNKVLNTDKAIISFIIFNAVFLPILYMTYRNIGVVKRYFTKLIQFAYILGVILFGLYLALIPQNEFSSIHVYILVIFGISAFVYLTPLESGLILFPVYLLFYFLLPYYQSNEEIITVLRINALIMNIAAWIFGAMVMRMRVITFIDKKIILKRNDQLKELAKRDSMTSLLNHEYVYKKLCEEIERARLTEYPLTVIMIDIDDFKRINDSFGHLVGDKIIIQIAQILVRTCRCSDIIGRYGGEEFIIILPETNMNDAVYLAERIRSTIEGTQFENGCKITISGGIMEYHGETAEELIMGADKSQYAAKENGKNRIMVFQ